MMDIVTKFEEKIALDTNVSENALVTSKVFESKVVILLLFICLNKALTLEEFLSQMIIFGSQFYFSVSLTNDDSKHLLRLIL